MCEMTTEQIEIKHREIRDKLAGYWIQDEWVAGECPTANDEDFTVSPKGTLRRDATLRLGCSSPTIGEEIKFAIKENLCRGEWTTKKAWDHKRSIHCLIQWLNASAPTSHSLMNHDFAEWRESLVDYMKTELGLKSRRVKENEECTFRAIYKIIEEEFDDRPRYERDTWNLAEMGFLKEDRHDDIRRLRFAGITQPCLRKAAKRYLRLSLIRESVGGAYSKLVILKHFSEFLAESYPAIQAPEINRDVALGYLAYSQETLAHNTRCTYLSQLRLFHEVCVSEGWLPLTNEPLIYPGEIPQPLQIKRRNIPEDIMMQLERNTSFLPNQERRMTEMLIETGQRIGDLCGTRFDCLQRDEDGDYSIEFAIEKTKGNHSIPVSQRTAAIIEEQQQYVIENFSRKTKTLFPWLRGETYKAYKFNKVLNQLAIEKNITDRFGDLWHFQSHQFRHTVATRMVNAGVPERFVQEFLGHKTSRMTHLYAELFDSSLKSAFNRFLEHREKERMDAVTEALSSDQPEQSDGKAA